MFTIKTAHHISGSKREPLGSANADRPTLRHHVRFLPVPRRFLHAFSSPFISSSIVAPFLNLVHFRKRLAIYDLVHRIPCF
jgi:hypothetical protein